MMSENYINMTSKELVDGTMYLVAKILGLETEESQD